MMLHPVVREVPHPHPHRVSRDTFIAALTPSERHALERCETVRPLPRVVAPDVWPLEDRLL